MTGGTFSLTRRDAVCATVASAALPMLGIGLLPAARAQENKETQMSEAKRPGHYKFPFGEMSVATLLDGYRQAEGPHPTFGADVGQEEMAALLQANFLPSTHYENHFNPVLVETGGEVVLFDTGFSPGSNPTAGMLQERMRSVGRTPEEVTLVVITHGHGDHISGLVTDGQPSFPNARYAIGQAEYDFWTSDRPAQLGSEGNARMFATNVVPHREKASFLKEGDTVAPGIMAIEAFGHTPGHMAFMLESGGRQLLLWADTTNHYVASLQRPEWHVRFDIDKEKAVETRKRILDMVATDRITAAGYHMPFPALGHVEKTAEGYCWVPVSYQLNLEG